MSDRNLVSETAREEQRDFGVRRAMLEAEATERSTERKAAAQATAKKYAFSSVV